jgi:tripartite-type tricarboxylate transporter receptor subunit TctC
MKNRKREICTSGSVRDEDGQPPHLLGRRNFLHLAAGAAALPALSRFAFAQAYPSRPVRWIVPFSPGGPFDIVARPMAQWLTERLGQEFVIDNRPGAGGNIGTETVVRASPDGYTLLMAATFNAINATLYDKLNHNFIRDIAPVATITRQPIVMVVNPSFPAKTVPEFIAYAKANPGKINFATGGVGSSPHVSGELLKTMAGINMIHVPYRGATPAITDLIAGQVHVVFTAPFGVIEHIRAGKLRALAVTTATSSAVGDFVPGFEATAWFGVGAPRKTPTEIIDKLNKEFNAALADPRMKARIADLGGSPVSMTPAEFGRLIVDETEKWAKVIKNAGIKPE